jgi:hypothetical protein
MSGRLDLTPTLLDAQCYVGLPYEDGVFDCADLVALVLREKWAKELPLPPHSERPGGRAGRRRVMSELRAALATRLDAPTHGGIVLMQMPDETGTQAAAVWHLGLLFMGHGDSWVLHNARSLGGVWLHRLRELGRLGLHVEGHYTCG